MNGYDTQRTINLDSGTGLLPIDIFHHGHFGHLPILHHDPGVIDGPVREKLPGGVMHTGPVFEGGGPPADGRPGQGIGFGLLPPNGGNGGNGGLDLSQFGPSQQVLADLANAGNSGGATSQLGPQVSYMPLTQTTTSSAGGAGLFVLLGVAIVGVLLYLHFRKAHHGA